MPNTSNERLNLISGDAEPMRSALGSSVLGRRSFVVEARLEAVFLRVAHLEAVFLGVAHLGVALGTS